MAQPPGSGPAGTVSAKLVIGIAVVAVALIAGIVALVSSGGGSGRLGSGRATGIERSGEQIELPEAEFVKSMCSEFKPAFADFLSEMKSKFSDQSTVDDPKEIAALGGELLSTWVAITADLNAKYRFEGADGQRASAAYQNAVEGAYKSIEYGQEQAASSANSDDLDEAATGLADLGSESGDMTDQEAEEGAMGLLLMFTLMGSMGSAMRGDTDLEEGVSSLFIAFALDKDSASGNPSEYVNDLETYYQDEPACTDLMAG